MFHRKIQISLRIAWVFFIGYPPEAEPRFTFPL